MIAEGLQLEPYACKSSESRGRAINENPSTARTEFQRDRDRIIHSAAFRRLEYKTQVFVNHVGDLFRTRLTHTLEVAQIARTVASRLGLNQDLAESIAYAHDLGHTPFGHAGQDALDECMSEYGGFEHNLQSLRIVDSLEEQYPKFDGLNLTWETREGILKHCSQEDARGLGDIAKRFLEGGQPSLEAQLVNIADAIAYCTHDIDDGLRAEYLEEDDLTLKQPFYEHFHTEVIHAYPTLSARRRQKEVVRRMIGYMVDDLVLNSTHNISKAKPTSVADVRSLSYPLISFSEEAKEQVTALKIYLFSHLYHHYRVLRENVKSAMVVKKLFSVFVAEPELLPPNHQAKIEKCGLHRTVSDYIAGMTDRYALLEYARVISPISGV